jgi:hypothetical protein
MATRRSSTSAIENDPQARQRTYETPPSSRAARLSPCSPSRVGSRSVSGTSAFAAVVHRSGAEVSRVRGRLNECAGSRRAHSGCLPPRFARGRNFAPTRSAPGHLLSHPPAAPRLESPRYRPKGPRVVDRFRRLAWGPACAGVPAGPPPAPLREKKMRSAAPEVPSSEGPTLSGGALFHSLSPTCGVEPAPFQSPRLAAHGRCVGGAATRPFTPRVD